MHVDTESEITNLVPQAPSSFPSFAVHTTNNRKPDRSLGTRPLIQYILPATESWTGAWEQDHSFSTYCQQQKAGQEPGNKTTHSVHTASNRKPDRSLGTRPLIQYILPATESRTGAWEQDHLFSTYCQQQKAGQEPGNKTTHSE